MPRRRPPGGPLGLLSPAASSRTDVSRRNCLLMFRSARGSRRSASRAWAQPPCDTSVSVKCYLTLFVMALSSRCLEPFDPSAVVRGGPDRPACAWPAEHETVAIAPGRDLGLGKKRVEDPRP